ncbi:hypothetical protein DEM27_15420 [Metarhizobium album]|uniref:Uncharacterized protein n=1 Tax=Metarhizobium album TaxID=2182425 RepID=A0A2U2DQ58_9HYPH|nr:hypothetical protein DEM27_15420 [Rhizobium album]
MTPCLTISTVERSVTILISQFSTYQPTTATAMHLLALHDICRLFMRRLFYFTFEEGSDGIRDRDIGVVGYLGSFDHSCVTFRALFSL